MASVLVNGASQGIGMATALVLARAGHTVQATMRDNVSSASGRIAASPLTPYVASTFALEALGEALTQEGKTFNIRVAIVQPGIGDTAMPRRIGEPAGPSHDPHTRRMADLFTASLRNPTSPFVAAERIHEIVESGTWQPWHPVGPDAAPFLRWRASMTGEEWVDGGAVQAESWYEAVESDFGPTHGGGSESEQEHAWTWRPVPHRARAGG